jgi:eukaryotic-like serine/threonine-protein kinase
MDPERWRKIEEILHAALALEAHARRAFLDTVCGHDQELRRELESLLAQQQEAGCFLETRVPGTESPPAAPLVGRQVGPYQIHGLLGAGGMGEVYRAHDSKLGREVALKALPATFARDPERLARFRREARTLANLNHPNIGMIYGLEESDEAICLVLELVEGEPLQGPLPMAKALDYAGQIAEALQTAHEKGVIHRDLKPANVKVNPQGRVKVLDFGLAKAAWGDSQAPVSNAAPVLGTETLVGQIMGTPPYMSPEQAQGRPVDQRTDTWSFGCLLYELLTGKRAFPGEGVSDTIAAVLEREPDWSALPAKTPTRIRRLLRRCLEKDAGRRLPAIRAAREEIDKVQRGLSRWQAAAMAAAAVTILAAGATVYLRAPVHPASRSEWVQLTNFPDSVSQPALSADGRMLAFVRSPETFAVPGEIYVKTLPNGEPVQLTSDNLSKMSPAFSPDGTRIAYTVVTQQDYVWDTWVAPSARGAPRPWLTNASGLIWLDKQQLLFSVVEPDLHMGVVTADEGRRARRWVYMPASSRGMAHRSYPSPDRKWVLLVEMERANWLPCRLVPMDGSSAGHPVGPPEGACTFAAWSPDGKWMYLSSSAGGSYHIWRQRFPAGQPEPLTSGPTEEEGIAVAPDGRSLITSVGLRQSAVFVHASGGDRQVSREGYSFDPKFTPDGKRLCYRVLKGVLPQSDPCELRIVDLDSGRDVPLLPSLKVSGQIGLAYDISRDGKQVVAAALDGEGKARLWIADVDGQAAPRQIPNVAGDYVHFGAAGEVFFRAFEGRSPYVYRANLDGSQLRRMVDLPAVPRSISPDGKWMVARVQTERASTQIGFPLQGGKPTRIYTGSTWYWHWSTDQTLLYISVPDSGVATTAAGRTYVIPLTPGQALPSVPEGGFQQADDLARLPGVRIIDAFDVAAGPNRDVWAFSRANAQRNLYRIPLP